MKSFTLPSSVTQCSVLFKRRCRSLISSRSKRSIRFRKYILLIVLLALTGFTYINTTFPTISYLNSPIVIDTEDVTGVSHLPLKLQKLISYSKFKLTDSSSSEFVPTADKEFDPRLMPSLLLAKTTRLINNNELDIDKFKIPFSWNDWVNLDLKLKASNRWYHHFIGKDFTCKSFTRYYNIRHHFGICESLEEKDIEKGFPQFKINGFCDRSYPQEVRAIMGASYLKHVAPPPDRVILLGAGPDDSALIIPTLKDPKTGIPIYGARNQSVIDSLEYIRYQSQLENKSLDEIAEQGISILEQVELFNKALNESQELGLNLRKDDLNITHDVVRLVNYDTVEGIEVNLTSSEFEFDQDKEIRRIKHIVALNGGVKDKQDLDYVLAKSMRNTISKAPDFEKHFHESAIIGRPIAGAHYDWRFFHKLDAPYYEHVAVLHRTIRAWLRFSTKAGITTWIAHGTMLSWYWNGLNMPWDTDADVQVTMASLYKLARSYNRSLVSDVTKERDVDASSTSATGIGKFYIDVAPSFFSRIKGNGQNDIDARFIDTETGLYVDITGLAFTNFYANKDLVDDKYVEFLKVLDANFTQHVNDPKINRAQYDEELLSAKQKAFDEKSMFHCRDNHHYSLEELSPLIPTLYEGVKAYVPHGFEKILKREYEKGLTNIKFHDHRYRPYLRLWVKDEICPDDKIGNNCRDATTLAEFRQTQHFTALHNVEMDIINHGNYVSYKREDEFAPLRIDPWFIRHVKSLIGFSNRNVVGYENPSL